MPALNREQIQAAAKVEDRYQTIPVPEWGGDVRLRKLSAAAGIQMGREHAALAKDDDGNPLSPDDAAAFYASLLALSIVDDEDRLQFDDDTGRAFLRSLTFGAQNVLGLAALRLNGMLAAQAEDREKNSMTPAGDSPST